MLNTMLLSLLVSLFSFTTPQTDTYKCTPCGQDCDNTTYTKPGSCGSCHMDLVKSTTINFTSVAPSAICDYISKHPTTVLLDVRTKEEFEGKADPNFGTLKYSINIPIQELEKRIAELNAYKNREILVFCSHSHRSPRAAHILGTHGFTRVVNMSGGMSQVGNVSCKR